jgi:glycosyltransferase involved in cell wall biosynthesis
LLGTAPEECSQHESRNLERGKDRSPVQGGSMPVTFSILTPTLQRDSLWRCCVSVDNQTFTDWQHIIIVDGGPLDANLLNSVTHPHRMVLGLPLRYFNFGNTPRHIGWRLAKGDYCLYLDDDNYFTHDDALQEISQHLESHPEWAVFPILRFGQRFFSSDPRNCHVDSANMVIRRDIAQWPNRDDYTADGILADELKTQYPVSAFPNVKPIITVPIQSKGE